MNNHNNLSTLQNVSPLLPPSDLAEYEKLFSGFAKWYMDNVDKEQQAKLENDKAAIDNAIALDKRKVLIIERAYYMTFIITLCFMGIVVFAIHEGQQWAAAGLGVPLVSICAILMKTTIKKNEDKNDSPK